MGPGSRSVGAKLFATVAAIVRHVSFLTSDYERRSVVARSSHNSFTAFSFVQTGCRLAGPQADLFDQGEEVANSTTVATESVNSA